MAGRGQEDRFSPLPVIRRTEPLVTAKNLPIVKMDRFLSSLGLNSVKLLSTIATNQWMQGVLFHEQTNGQRDNIKEQTVYEAPIILDDQDVSAVQEDLSGEGDDVGCQLPKPLLKKEKEHYHPCFCHMIKQDKNGAGSVHILG